MIEEAIKHCEEAAKEQDKLCKRYDDASGYTRSHNEDIRTTGAIGCEVCAEEYRQLAEWLKDYKRLLEQEPCGKDINVPATDAISRQAVLDGLASIAKAKAKSDAQKSLMGRVMFFTEHLPSVTPQSKAGHWIRMKAYEKWGCSECHTVFRFTFKEHDFCPNCGARMVEPQESEDRNDLQRV